MAIINDLVVRCPVLKLSKKPEFNSETLDELLYGMVVHKVLNCEDSGYLKVRTEYGYEGWCLKSGLLENEWNVRKYINQTNAKVHALFTDVLEAPVIRSKIICTLVKGSFIAAVNSSDGWTKIYLANGDSGYVRSSGIISADKIKNNYSIREDIIDDAFMYIGTQYRWGGKTPNGIDCSGLTSMVYMNNGMLIHRDSGWESGYGIEKIDLSEAAKGDLLYFTGHIGLYIGDGRFIHSTMGEYGDGVRINSLNKSHAGYREDLHEKFLYVGRKITNKC